MGQIRRKDVGQQVSAPWVTRGGFDESLHPRASDGRFASRDVAEQESGLNALASAVVDSGTWYHAGNPDVIPEGQYLHLGTQDAAQCRRDMYPHRALHRFELAPRRALGSPDEPLSDKQVNTLDLWSQAHPDSVPASEAEACAFDRESATSGAYGLRLWDVIQDTGWTPDVDAMYYSNDVEDSGSVSVAVKRSAIVARDEVIGEQLPLWGSNDQYGFPVDETAAPRPAPIS